MKAQESEAEDRTDLSITVCENGVINCRNPEYDNGHTYSVFVDNDGSVLRCTCDGHRYHGHCYHADEVESRPLIVSSAQSLAATYTEVAADGGRVEEYPEITHHTEAKQHGGQRYARCEGCGSESVEDSEGDTSILHDQDCARRENRGSEDDSSDRTVVDPYADRVAERKEVNETPL